MLWEAVGTALAAAFSPWTLLVVAHVLGQPGPRRLAFTLLTSAALLTLAVGYTVVLALGSTGADDEHKHRTVSATLDVALGLLILLGALFLARRPRKPPKPRREVGLLGVVVLGLTVGSPSALYLTALHSLSKTRPGPTAAALEVLLIAALVLLMVEVPIAAFLVAPERTTAGLELVNGWLAAHGRALGVAAAVVVGLYFLVAGVVRLG